MIGTTILRTEVAAILTSAARNEARLRLTKDYTWFQWEDMNTAGPFEVGGYVVRFVKDWSQLCGVENAVAPDGRETDEWFDPCVLMDSNDYDALKSRLRTIGSMEVINGK